MNNKEVKLSRADLEMLQRIRRGTYAEKSMDPFPEFDHYEVDKIIHPLSGNVDEPKRRFVASKWERLKVSKFIRAMQKGWMKTMAELEEEEREKEKEEDRAWDIWADDSIVSWKPRRMPKAITAPKRDLPVHAESFNPPEEYLFD